MEGGISIAMQYDKRKVTGILLVRDVFLDIYIPSFSQKVYTLQLPSSVYVNMELVDSDAFAKFVSDFFAVNALPPLEVCMVIQSPILKKEFSLLPQAQLDKAIQTYLDYVPFDTVVSKRVVSEKGVLVIAANGDYIDSIKGTLSQLGGSVTCVTPLEGLAFVPQGGVTSLTEELAQSMLKNINQIRQEAFQVAVQKELDEFEVVEIPDKPSQPASQLPLLLGIFGILLAVLVAVYINMGQDFGLTPRPVRRKTVIPTLIPTSGAGVKGVATQAFPRIVIATSEQHKAIAYKVAEMIHEEGYEDVVVDISLAITNPRTTLIIPKGVEPALRYKISVDMRRVIPDMYEREGSTEQKHILLLLEN